MKRFHVSLGVRDLARSVEFYTTLFGEEPSVRKDDYAKWMLEDPRLNFSITAGRSSHGIQHVGLQADTLDELGEIQARLRAAEEATFEQPETECCYARSTKTWAEDPDRVAWETFVTHEAIEHFGGEPEAQRCCA